MHDSEQTPSRLANHVDFARRLARGLVSDPAASEDLAQSALVVALEHPPRDAASERSFLRTVLRRTASRERRSAERRQRRERTAARPESVTPTDELVAAMEVHRLIVDELMSLPPNYKEVLLLRFFNDLSAAAIAEHLDTPLETVRTRLRRGLERMRATLDARHDGDRRSWLAALAPLANSEDTVPPVHPWALSIRTIAAIAAAAAVLLAVFVASQRESLAELYAKNAAETQPANSTQAGTLAMVGLGAVPTVGLGTVEEDDEGPLERALGLEIGRLKPVDAPKRNVIGAIAKATDWKAKAVGAAELYSASTEDDRDIYLARVPMQGSESGSSALLALDHQHKFVAGAVIDEKQQAIAEWKHFMDGMKWYDLPHLEGAKPWSSVESMRAEAKKVGDDDAQLLLGLLDLMEAMNDQASVFNLPDDRREHSELGEAALVADSYRRIATLTPSLAAILGDSASDFERMAVESAELADELSAAIKKEDVRAGKRAQRKIMRSCQGCHDLPATGFEGGLKEASKSMREALGIGNGFLRVGHDIRIRHPERERMQEVADALRVAALLIDTIDA